MLSCEGILQVSCMIMTCPVGHFPAMCHFCICLVCLFLSAYQQVSADVELERARHQIWLNVYPGSRVGYSGLTGKRVRELQALPLGPAASSHRARREATVRGRRSVCCFRLDCAESQACVYLLPLPRFI